MVFLLCLGLTARATRLITDDYLTRRFRMWIVRLAGPESSIAYLIGCPFCLSMYIAGGAYTLGYFYGHTAAFVIVAGALTASWIAGQAASYLDGAGPTEEQTE